MGTSPRSRSSGCGRPWWPAGTWTTTGYQQAAARARDRVAEAVSAAEAAPLPDPATVTDGVTATELNVRSGS